MLCEGAKQAPRVLPSVFNGRLGLVLGGEECFVLFVGFTVVSLEERACDDEKPGEGIVLASLDLGPDSDGIVA